MDVEGITVREISLAVVRGVPSLREWEAFCRREYSTFLGFPGPKKILADLEAYLPKVDKVSPQAVSILFGALSPWGELKVRDRQRTAARLERVVEELIRLGSGWRREDLFPALSFGVAQVLVRHGADVRAYSPVLRAHFLEAAVSSPNGHKVLEEAFRLHGTEGLFPEGFHPAHRAAAAGAVKVLRVLERWGFPLDGPDEMGRTPLHHAARNGRTQALRFLLARGASPDGREGVPSPLAGALMEGHGRAALLLLEGGADPFGAGEREAGLIPAHFLHFAARRGCGREPVLRLAERLIPDQEALARLRGEGVRPIAPALAMVPFPEVVALALERGVDPAAPEEEGDGDSALAVAMRHGNLEVARLLVERRGVFGDPSVLAREVLGTRDGFLFGAVLSHLKGTPFEEELKAKALSSPWEGFLEGLLSGVSDEGERRELLLAWTALGKQDPDPEEVLRLARGVRREAVEEVHRALARKRGKRRALAWALSTLLDRGEEALEALGEL